MKKAMMVIMMAAILPGFVMTSVGEEAKKPKKVKKPKKDGQMVKFQQLDTNGDASVSIEEMKVRAGDSEKKQASAEKKFRALDSNGDSRLTFEEFAAGAKVKKDKPPKKEKKKKKKKDNAEL